MEAVGTALGIASLGIQICQGLLSYYDSWKDYDSDVRKTYETITDLSKTLALLQSFLGREDVDEERLERVRACLKDCEHELLALEEKRRSLQERSSPEGAREKLRSTFQRAQYPFRKDSLRKVKVNVIDAQERLKLALQVLQLGNDAEARDLLSSLQEKATAHAELLAQIEAQNRRFLDMQQSQEFRNIISWLSASDPWTNHDSARKQHESHTGDWLLQSKQYQKWKSIEGSRLCMFGKAGCGKTVLCSTAIEDIKTHCQQNLDTAYAVFYFTFSDEHKQSSKDLLRSLVAQLAWKEPGLTMLRQAYSPERRQPTSAELEKILMASIGSYGRVYLLVDALDECPEERDARQDVMKLIEQLIQGNSNLSVLATSREVVQISDTMAELGASPLKIETSVVDEDIRTYVSKQLSTDRRFRRFSPESLALIESTITAKADGMFRWVDCQLQDLKKLKSTAPKYVKHALKALPITLDETYERILLQIEDIYHQHALTLLQWLAYARSPPTLAQLVEAAIIDPNEDSNIDVENRGNLEDALNILSGLVMTEVILKAEERSDSETGNSASDSTSEDSDAARFQSHEYDTSQPIRSLTPTTRVRLAHFSVKEYLESERFLESTVNYFYLSSGTGHRFLTQSCLTYLRHYSESSEKTSTPQDLELFPLLDYAAYSWPYHSALRKKNDERFEADFLQLQQARCAWTLVYNPDVSAPPPFQSERKGVPAIYYASLLGLEAVVHQLLEDGADVKAEGGDLRDALSAASSSGDAAIVRLLLDRGADAGAQGGRALRTASRKGRKEVVQLLLERGADVLAEGGRSGTATQAAAFEGEREILNLLLSKGANVNAEGGGYGSALQAASFEDEEETVKLLLDNGADVNAVSGQFGSALSAAAYCAHWSVVELLLEKGADLDICCDIGRTALSWAAIGGQHLLFRTLLEKCAAVGDRSTLDLLQSPDKLGCSAIHHFAMGKSPEGVTMVLHAGVDVDSPDSQGWTALHWSSYFDCESVVSLLLSRGAKRELPDIQGSNALQVSQAIRATPILIMHGDTANHEPLGFDHETGTDRTGVYCDCCRIVCHAPK